MKSYPIFRTSDSEQLYTVNATPEELIKKGYRIRANANDGERVWEYAPDIGTILVYWDKLKG